MRKLNEKVVVKSPIVYGRPYVVTKLVNRMKPMVGKEVTETELKNLLRLAKERPACNGKLTIEIV
jgi:hypothetical protein